MNNLDYEFKLNRFSAQFLFKHATFKNRVVYVDDGIVENAILPAEPKKDCHVFSQTLKEYSYMNLNELKKMYILIDFHGFTYFDKMMENPDGFVINIDGKKIHYVMFLKSNSMSKNSMMLYMNKDYFDDVNRRVNFGYDKVDNLVLAKWFAYSGLALTDATMVEDLRLNFDEVCIIDDLDEITRADEVVTAVSIPLIIDKIKQYQQSTDPQEKARIKEEFDCYEASPDFDHLECKDLIIECQKYIKNPANKDLFDTIIPQYQLFQNILSDITWEKITLKNYPIDINMFDGEGLIDLESAAIINEALEDSEKEFYDEDDDLEYNSDITSYSFQIRLPFIKGVVHACDFKSFFRDKGIKKIKGLSFSKNKKYYEYDIENLKLILTKSQFKASSIFKEIIRKDPKRNCLEEYFDKLEKYDYCLAVSGLEPKQENEVKLCYQFFSTLPLNKEALDSLYNYNISIINERTNIDNIIQEMSMSEDIKDLNCVKTYKLNKDFALSSHYLVNKRQNLFKDIKSKMKIGQLMTPGYRKILCGDLLSLLYHAAGLKLDETNLLGKDQFYTPGDDLDYNKNYVLLRNPHYSRNEIVLLTHATPNQERKQYFEHLTGVIMLNPLSFASERLGGADYDGDTIIILSDEKIVNACKNELFKDNKYIYPVVKIPSLKIKREECKTNSNKQKVVCLRNTFTSATGLISNIAYTKATYIYQDKEDIRKSDAIAFYTILGGLEIDSAKSGKKPSLEGAKRKYKPPRFIQLKDHILNRKLISKSINTFSSIEKAYLKENRNDLVYLTYKTFNDIKLEKLDHEKITISKPKKVDVKKTKQILIQFEALNYIFAGLNNITKMQKSNIKSVKEFIINEVAQVFEDNNYDLNYLNTFINKFKTFNPHNTMREYCDSLHKYHFMTNQDEKEEFLKNMRFELTNFDKNIITNFKNGGFKLLYLILYYHKLPVKDFNIKYDDIIENENPFIHSKKDVISYFSEEEIKMMRRELVETISTISKQIHLNDSITNIKDHLEKGYIINLSKISINDLSVVMDVFKTDFIYSTYFYPLEKYLKEAK